MKSRPNEQLRAWRKSRGYTQGQVAELLGVSQASYSRWETGAAVPWEQYRHRIEVMAKIRWGRAQR